MMKLAIAPVFLGLMLAASLTAFSCTSPKGEPSKDEGFAIYLLARDIPVSEMPIVSNLELADEPIISLGDIVSYYRNTHKIELTAEGYERLLELEVPTNGKVFVVCIDRRPVYWGAFWVAYSSMTFDGVTILAPLSPDRHAIQIEPGYPTESFYSGKDPRSNPEIMQSLQQAGKLR
jgi:hypothetical protein